MSQIRLKLISGECKVVANLSRTLGQHQINTAKFSLKFNNLSNELFIDGILFHVTIQKKTKEIYEIFIRTPCLKFLIKNFAILNNNFFLLSLEKLYDLYLIYNNLSLNFNISVKSFFGSLKTFSNVKILMKK